MHPNEARQTKQLEMQLGVVQNAINKLIGIVSSNTLEIQKIQRRVDQLSRGGVNNSSNNVPSGESKTENADDNYELDISQVQKILKQQSAAPATLGRRIINN